MAHDVLLPQWGMEMQEATVLTWLKQEGDEVAEGEALCEVETAKFTTQVEATASGILARLLVSEGRTVPVRERLAIIADPGEEVPREDATEAASAGATGVTTAAPPPAAGPAPDIPVRTVVQISGIRGAVARRMVQSSRETAAVTLTTEADVTELVQLQRDLLREWRRHRVRPMDQEFIVMAVARELQSHPRLNALLVEDQIWELQEINIGVAMAVSDGLVVPVVRNADRKSLLEIAQEVRDLATRARKHDLGPEETMGGSFTTTALGAMDIDAFTPIINPPQVAILGSGRTTEKPAVRDGQVAVRSMMYLSLTFDHRALDGIPAGEFLRGVKRSLESPKWMGDT